MKENSTLVDLLHGITREVTIATEKLIKSTGGTTYEIGELVTRGLISRKLENLATRYSK